MAYTKTTWVNGSSPYLNADNLNKIEQGIADAHTLVGGGSGIPEGYTAPGGSVDRTGTNNVQAALQTILDGGGKLYLGPGTYRCTSALLLDSNCHIYVAPGAKLLMDFATSGATASSQIRTRNLTGGTGYYNAIQPSHDVWIYGPGEISQGPAVAGGNLFCIAGDRLVMKDFTTTRWDGGRWLIGVGDDWRLYNVRAVGGDLSGSGNGGLRFMGGKRFQAWGLHIESGDDTFQFVPAGSFADPLFDVGIEDSFYIGCSGSSSSARLMVIVSQDQNNNGTTGMDQPIKRCGFIACSGLTGGASVVIQNASSSVPIEDCYIIGCTIDGSQNAGTGQPGALYINGYSTTGGIKKLLIDKLVIRGSHRKGVHFDRGGEDVILRDCVFERGTTASDAVAEIGGIRTKVLGCIFDGGSAGTGNIISVETNNGPAPERTIIDGCTFLNIPSGTRYGVTILNGDGVQISNNIFLQKSGATTARAFNISSGITNVKTYNNDMRSLTDSTKYVDAGTGSLIGSTAITA